MKATFLVAEQKDQLGKLGQILSHIESCDLLGEIDPAYYGERKQAYITEYATQMSRLAQTIFKKGAVTPNVRMLGAVKVA